MTEDSTVERKRKKRKLYDALVRIGARVNAFLKVVFSKERYRDAIIGTLATMAPVIVLIVVLADAVAEMNRRPGDRFADNEPGISVSSADVVGQTGDSDETEGMNVNETTEGDDGGEVAHGNLNMDIVALKAINPDVVGWIYFEGGEISYPILQGDDDNEYLHTTYDGRYSYEGSIILETLNSDDFTDRHTIIYGHCMRNLTMFGRLRYYRDRRNYYRDHQYFQLIYFDENGEVVRHRYRIFACRDVSVDDDCYYVYDEQYTKIAEFANEVLKKDNNLAAEEVSDIEILEDDYIVTLSTCSTKSDRMIISAVRCEE